MLTRLGSPQATLRGLASSSSSARLPTSSSLRRSSPTPAVEAWQLLQRRSYTRAHTAPSFDPRQSVPGSPPPDPSPPKERSTSATAQFYRDLVPAMLHCLALGSIVYYALELTWMTLAREKQGEELRARVEQLEGQLAEARAGKVDAQEVGQAARRSWWKLW